MSRTVLRRIAIVLGVLYFAGLIWLVAAALFRPIDPYGRALLPFTGCRRMDFVVFYKYFAGYCLLLTVLYPFFFHAFDLRGRAFAIYLLLLPVAGEVLHNTTVRSAFRYRMELRERYGKDPKGYLAVDRLMPPEVKAEYHGLKVRAKTCKVALFLGWLPLTLWGLLIALLTAIARQLVRAGRSLLPSGSREDRA